MKRKWTLRLYILILIEFTGTNYVGIESIRDLRVRGHGNEGSENNEIQNIAIASNSSRIDVNGGHGYGGWGVWSGCRDGRRTRRRRCLHPKACGDSLQVEVASCETSHVPSGLLPLNVQTATRRQLELHEDVQKRFRGFSAWSSWSSCSRRCTTVRKRYCRKPAFCGRKIIRQSAYCYLEGTFCHRWIRGRMQRRKDPEYTVVQTLPPPVLAFHPEDTKVSGAVLECGKLGQYRSAAAARRARMRDMVRIIGGRPAPPGKWPWQVAVLNRYKRPPRKVLPDESVRILLETRPAIAVAAEVYIMLFSNSEEIRKEAFCGGTLISLRWVVSAAHCVRKRLYVRLGEHDLLIRNHGEVEMKVKEAVIHPLYDPDTVVNDVAMLRLPGAARPDLGHGIACLPDASHALAPHTSCVILGWGKKRATDVHGTRILHEAQVSTVQQGVCRRSYWQYAITDNMVCAGRGRRDSCAGDSGGPLLCRNRDMRYYLQGITSFGDGCGKRGKYGIYTRTAGYVAWINNIMSNKYFDD